MDDPVRPAPADRTDDSEDASADPAVPVFPGFREMAERWSARRQALGLSQTAVAARMGTSQSAVARIESGATDVRLSTLHRYAAALGETLAVELRDAEQPPGGER